MIYTSNYYYDMFEKFKDNQKECESLQPRLLEYISILEKERSQLPQGEKSNIADILFTELFLAMSINEHIDIKHVSDSFNTILSRYILREMPLDKAGYEELSNRDKEIIDCFIQEYCKFRGEITGKEIRSQKSYIAWAGAVKLRDEFKCKKCGLSESLHTHHVIPVSVNSDFALDINNGITLCQKCHTEFHSKYGKDSCGFVELNAFLTVGAV